jgi:antibiotic biosynthesis monooxygenase (ABM) superfamily enzyme
MESYLVCIMMNYSVIYEGTEKNKMQEGMERWFTFPDMEEQVSQYRIVYLKRYNSFRLVHGFSMIMENLNKMCHRR